MEKTLGTLSKEYSAVVAILMMGVFFSLMSPYFSTGRNLKNVLLQCATLATVANGQALIVISGNLDLSLGQRVCLSSVIGAYLMRFMGMNPWVATFRTLTVGCIVGLCDGLLAAYTGLPAFIATLGTQMVCQNFSKIITNAAPIARLLRGIAFLGRGYLGPIPICMLIMLAIYVVVQFVSTKTGLGRSISTVSGGSEAAYSAGVPAKRYLCITYIIGGLLIAVGGMLSMSRPDSISISSGSQYELDSLIAYTIDGLPTTGGKGGVVGVLFGTIFLTMLFNGMAMADVESLYQSAIKGTVLIITITANVLRSKEKN